MATGAPSLSVVVVAHAMDRELPRTLRSLLPGYQQGLAGDEIEVIVVDNGSPTPVAETLPAPLLERVQVHRIDDAPPSPAHAANTGIQRAQGPLVGLVVDGARLASPGLLGGALLGAGLHPRAVVTAPAWHLGTTLHADAGAQGYDAATEDALLARVGWEDDGYRLFGEATPAASSHRGLFGGMGESSSLFMPRALWDELGGLDERFTLPGGGLVNHDLYRRALSLPDVQLVVLLGEGTFHQIHGGAATSGKVTREAMRAQYEEIVGQAHRPPEAEATYIGTVPPAYVPYLVRSAQQALDRRDGV